MPELPKRLDGRTAHRLAAHDPEARRFHAEHDVLHHRQVRRERQLLVDHHDAGAAGGERVAGSVRDAVEHERAGVGPERAGEHGHQRALSCAVLPDEGADFTGPHIEIDVVQRHGGAECLADAAHLEAWRRRY